jgi:hypothetical protein
MEKNLEVQLEDEEEQQDNTAFMCDEAWKEQHLESLINDAVS